MKKTLLLSVVASTMIMAGGDIAPVEPAVEAPVAAVSAWNFGGQAVAYYQTSDKGDGSLFAEEDSIGNTGLQLRATNDNLAYGIGAGFEASTLSKFPFGTDGNTQTATDSGNSGGWLSQAYLTYGMGNTSLKVGRQELPKGLSPFAFSEGWNVFKNTFDAALVVNSDIENTTLVYAYVDSSNSVKEKTRKFRDIHQGPNKAEKGVHMVTGQYNAGSAVLTGSWYHAADMLGTEDVNILWGDAKFGLGGVKLAAQLGGIYGADEIGLSDTFAYGLKAGYNFGMFNASAAYSSVDEGTVSVHNMGTSVKTPLYTQMVLNQDLIKTDSDTFVLRAGMKAAGGKIGIAYNHSELGDDNHGSDESYSEFDLTYKTKLNANTTFFAAYVWNEFSTTSGDSDASTVRLWGRYNF